MQTTLGQRGVSRVLETRNPALNQSQLVLVPARRRAARRSCTTRAAFGTAAAAVGGGQGLQTFIAQAVGWGLAGLFVALQLKQEQDVQKEGRRECGTCGGSGLVECICTKWSDGDTGCGACGGSGMMECTSCGGGGTAVPIEAKVYVKGRSERDRTYY